MDEKGVCHRYSMMKQQKQQENNKFEAMHKALKEGTQAASGVEEFKCHLCPETNLKMRHCNTAEVHPLKITFCDDCRDFFNCKDSLLRHQSNPPPKCKGAMQEEAKKHKEGVTAPQGRKGQGRL